ncbi:hypothetical protein LRS74_06575 [Streptomyces sp. LX-29]|uniref:hypothetical protein n=1 Tax=Streptomyces sp. LX-29 TaxID=2900152 RepID=UPI00240E4D4F|nr:hypothetical protein [Streptomyces sp. LX-29]WFB06747.1 hypothetical protein LRS74_06575 [Streptomyces sp. LX-29]
MTSQDAQQREREMPRGGMEPRAAARADTRAGGIETPSMPAGGMKTPRMAAGGTRAADSETAGTTGMDTTGMEARGMEARGMETTAMETRRQAMPRGDMAPWAATARVPEADQEMPHGDLRGMRSAPAGAAATGARDMPRGDMRS